MDPRQQRILIWIGGLIAVLLVIIVVLLVTEDGETVAADATTSTGVSTSSQPPTTSSETSTGSSTSPSTTPSSTISTGATTTATPAPDGACSGLPGATIPGPEPGVTFAVGDFDGDGADDQLIGYQDAGGTWWVQMALDYGYATQTAVAGPVTALGATDFGTGQDVAYAYVDSGASVSLVGFYFLPGCDVFEVIANGAGVARYPVGGGVMHLDGVSCVSDGIITKSATTDDGTTWEYSTTRWAWVPGLVEMQSVSSSITLLSSPADDDVIFGAASFDCPLTSP